jgi:hypothetical protein
MSARLLTPNVYRRTWRHVFLRRQRSREQEAYLSVLLVSELSEQTRFPRNRGTFRRRQAGSLRVLKLVQGARQGVSAHAARAFCPVVVSQQNAGSFILRQV